MARGGGINRRTFLKGAAGTALALALARGPYVSARRQRRLRAGFVYLTSPGDAGWTFRHEQGRLFMEQEFPRTTAGAGVALESAVAENVPDPDAERIARNFAAQGFDIVFATSFGFMDGTLAAAADFPNVRFEHCSGFKVGANMGNYFGRMEQARYLTGLVAGAMTRTNLLGYVAAIPIPEVIRILNAFALGARAANPSVQMRVVGLGSFFDPPKARESAFALIDAGADVVTMHEDTPAVPTAAQDRGVFSVGYQSDMSAFAPNSHLTSVFWNWGPYYLRTLERLASGEEYTVQTIYSGFENREGLVEPLVGISNTTGGGAGGLVNEDLIRSIAGEAKLREILDLVETKRQEILNDPFLGNGVVFRGPIRNSQTGEIVIPEGVVPSDLHLLSMDYPVDNVTGPGFFPAASNAAPPFQGVRGVGQATVTYSGSATGIGFLNITISAEGGARGFSTGPRGFVPGTGAASIAAQMAAAINAGGVFIASASGNSLAITSPGLADVSAQSGDSGVSVNVA